MEKPFINQTDYLLFLPKNLLFRIESSPDHPVDRRSSLPTVSFDILQFQ